MPCQRLVTYEIYDEISSVVPFSLVSDVIQFRSHQSHYITCWKLDSSQTTSSMNAKTSP